MNVRRQLARQTRAIAMIVLIAGAGLASAMYLLTNERLASPFATSYTINAPFTNVSGVQPGLGIPVNVAGVRVGQVTGSALQNGEGVLRLAIDPHVLPRVYANAIASLVPRTPLMDMQVQLSAGGPPGRPLSDGATLPITQTRTPVDSDQLLSVLDTDTRTYVQMLVSDLGTGLHGRGRDLGLLLRALSPTVAQTREIGDLLASRRGEISQIVHDLSRLTQALAGGDQQLGQVVAAGDRTLNALATQQAPLRASVAQLPGTLAAARTTLSHLTTFTHVLRPTLAALTPLAGRLPGLLRNSRTLLSGGGVLPVAATRAFADASQPLAAVIGPTTRAVTAAIPPFVRIAGTVQRVTNTTAYVPDARDQGYLYWFAWFVHNLNSVLSTQDAHGAVIRGLTLVSCSSASTANPGSRLVDQLLGLPSQCRPGP